MLSTKNNFKNYSEDIIVDFQNSLYRFFKIINNTLGSTKARSNLTLPYEFEMIPTAIKNFEMR